MSIFAGHVLPASQNPYLIIVYSWSSLFCYRPYLSQFGAKDYDFLNFNFLKQCDPILVTLLKVSGKVTPL